jgi:hypothetical protein
MQIGVNSPGGRDQTLHSGKLETLEHAAFDPQPSQHAGHIGNRLSRKPVAAPEKGGNLPHPGKLQTNPFEICRWPPAAKPRRAQRPCGMCGHTVENRRELDCLECIRTLFCR